jgi:hypothetical protein
VSPSACPGPGWLPPSLTLTLARILPLPLAPTRTLPLARLATFELEAEKLLQLAERSWRASVAAQLRAPLEAGRGDNHGTAGGGDDQRAPLLLAPLQAALVRASP